MDELQPQIFEFEGFRLDPGKRLLINSKGESVPLMPKAFETLLYLVRNSGRLIEKDELMRAIWTDTIVEENNLNQNITILRRVFGEKRGEHRFIATIPGKGYEFVADVSAVPLSEEKSATETGSHGAAAKPASRTLGVIPALALFALLIAGSAGLVLWLKSPSRSPDSRVRSMAVLPFKPLVRENRDEALEMGMADTLIARLSHTSQTVVVPLSSVRKYDQLNQDVLGVGRELGVDAILDGSIQRWGDKIRVNVRLMKVEDGSSLWTGTFDENFGDIFIVQDAISNRVASALAFQLIGDEHGRIEKRYTTNAKAYEFYLRGRYHAFKITRPENQIAIEYFRKAIDADPEYALAYAGLADAFRVQAIGAFASPTVAGPQAKAYAMKALEIDDTLTDAYVVLGWIEFQYDWEWANSERHLRKAIELSPNNSEAHRAYSHLLSNLARHEEAIAEGQKAIDLAPLTLITSTLHGYTLMYAGRYEEAVSTLTRVIELDSNFWTSHNALGRVYTVQERYEEAIALITKAKEVAAGRTTEPTAQLGYVLGKSGKRDAAMAVLAELEAGSAREYVPKYFLAVVHNGLGDREQTLKHLEEAFREREVQMIFLNVDTRWDWLRSDARFVDLTTKMNFP
jgi:DNA-binding winged helix-turn-helix (wHTH) protein/TolB-like protein/Flp pilus assembly protein TadD